MKLKKKRKYRIKTRRPRVGTQPEVLSIIEGTPCLERDVLGVRRRGVVLVRRSAVVEPYVAEWMSDVGAAYIRGLITAACHGRVFALPAGPNEIDFTPSEGAEIRLNCPHDLARAMRAAGADAVRKVLSEAFLPASDHKSDADL